VSDFRRTTVLVRAEPTPRRDRTAIAASIAVHLCALALLALTVPRASFPVDDPDERTLLTTILHVEKRPPPRIATVQRLVERPAPAVATAQLPVIHAAVTVEHAARRLVVATEHRAGFAPSPTAPRRLQPTTAQAVTRLAVEKPVAAAAESAATAAPVASPAPSPVVAQREEGIGNFGETYPASVEPSLRGTLLAGVNGFVVRVTVDENGHAVSIEFVRPPSDPAQREELRTRLLAAHFIPAACNGLRCAGTLELKN
jgi:hypothetical protein